MANTHKFELSYGNPTKTIEGEFSADNGNGLTVSYSAIPAEMKQDYFQHLGNILEQARGILASSGKLTKIEIKEI